MVEYYHNEIIIITIIVTTLTRMGSPVVPDSIIALPISPTDGINQFSFFPIKSLKKKEKERKRNDRPMHESLPSPPHQATITPDMIHGPEPWTRPASEFPKP